MSRRRLRFDSARAAAYITDPSVSKSRHGRRSRVEPASTSRHARRATTPRSSSEAADAQDAIDRPGHCCLARRLLKPAPAPEPVRAVRRHDDPGRQRGRRAHEFAAEVRARIESRLAFASAARSRGARSDLGERVKAGQVLAQLDPQDCQLAARTRRARRWPPPRPTCDLAAADYKRYRVCATRTSSAAPNSSGATPRSRRRRRSSTRPRRRPHARATRPPTPRWWPTRPASSPASRPSRARWSAAGTPVVRHRAGRPARRGVLGARGPGRLLRAAGHGPRCACASGAATTRC